MCDIPLATDQAGQQLPPMRALLGRPGVNKILFRPAREKLCQQRPRGHANEDHAKRLGERHRHGASPTTAMTHIAIQEALDGKAVDWMEKVSDDQYERR